MRRIDRRYTAKAGGSVLVVSALSAAAKWAGLEPESIASVVIPVAVASGITSGIIRRTSVDSQLYNLSLAFSETPGLSAMCTPSDAKDLRARLSTDLDSGIIAKYWIVRGKTPKSQGLTTVLQEIQDTEASCYRGLPKLDPEVALRIVGGIVELPPQELEYLERPEIQADWQIRRAALEKAMVEARYYQILALEQRRLRDGTGQGGRNQEAKENPAGYDVPSQGQVAVFFLLTGEVPKPDVGGLAVARAIRRMQRDRVAPIDPVAAKHAVFLLLGLSNQHDAFLPAHNDARRAIDGFPYSYGAPAEKAAPLYDAIMRQPVSVLDAFIGRDGWHYVRGPASARSHECIVARKGDRVSCIIARRNRVEKEWGIFKAERCSIPLIINEDTSTWSAMLRVQLADQRARAEGMADAVEFTWPSENGAWADGRRRLQAWAQSDLQTKPSARRISVPRMTARIGPSTLV